MPLGTLAFVGRDAELDELRDGIAGALAGRGGMWLLSGEPGIGKSRLAEELVRAAGDDVIALWGRCSEAGGAPAYWPWIQILRALIRRGSTPTEAQAAHLVQLLPELRGARPAESTATGADHARFALMDAVTGALCDAAAARPLLLVLEDLHVADSSSLALLAFLLDQVRGASIAAIGTYRDAEAHDCEGLLKIAGAARVVPLRRLARDDVGRYLTAALGADPGGEVVSAVHDRTEGNPLFVVELARLLVARGGGAATEIPTTIRSAVGRRLDAVSAATREVLELGAVIGREFRVADLADAFDRDPLALGDALAEARRAAIVDADGAGRFRFSHILVRGHIYDEIDPARRAAAHGRIGRALEQAGGEPATVAHHLIAAGDERAVDAAVRAARAAAAQWAVDDVAEWYRRALDVLAETGGAPARVAEIRLGLAEATMYAGELDAGRAECRRVAALARELDDPELMARAALACGSVLVFGQVDSRLISLLEEARDALPAADSDLRARVLARLAAALQPAADPSGPIALAREAIAMARRCGTPETRLAALRAGCSAMMDLADPRERIDLNREQVELATQLGDPVEAIRGHTRLAIDCFELGDLIGMRAAIDQVTAIAARLNHPAYGWRVDMFEMAIALWQGRLADASANMDAAVRLAARSNDPNVWLGIHWGRAELGMVRGDFEQVFVDVAALGHGFETSPLGARVVNLIECEMLYRMGRGDEIAARVDRDAVEFMARFADRTSWSALSVIACAIGDRELARATRERMRASIDQVTSNGVLGMTLGGPIARLLGLVELLLDEPDAGLRHLEIARERALRLGGRPIAAQIALELAIGLIRTGGDRDRAARLIAGADATIAELGLVGMRPFADLARAELVRSPAAGPPPSTPALHIRREGELWAITAGGAPIRLPDMKGLHVLARLVAEPGREFHALDLLGAASDGVVDRGDAGELLDERAREQYQTRLRELEAEIERAEEWNDTARAEAARQERDFLTAEISRAVGLGGRARRTGSAAERARINIQRRVSSAIKKIAEHDPALGRHLERSIVTGTFCSYDPV